MSEHGPTEKNVIGAHARGVRVATRPKKHVQVKLKACSRCRGGCVEHELIGPFRRIGVARDGLTPVTAQPLEDEICRGQWLGFGQDILHSNDRKWLTPDPEKPDAPPEEAKSVDPALARFRGVDVESVLKDDVRGLLEVFAKKAETPAPRRLIEAFLSKKSKNEIFSSPFLDRSVKKHERFQDFARLVLNAPDHPARPKSKSYERTCAPGPDRVHQSLRKAGWDVNAAETITDMKPLAFNLGVDKRRFYIFEKDYANGMALMMNGIQYVMVDVVGYRYRSCEQKYKIDLRFAMYDVFGLDDVDLRKFGADTRMHLAALVGVTAWWQLQHQYDYAPLITRAIVKESFEVSTALSGQESSS